MSPSAFVNVREITPELQKIASGQLNEVPERIANDITALRTWIQQQPHLRARTDDQFLLAFLRGCKYSLEKAKSKIDKFYTLRTKFPEIFSITDADYERLLEVLRLGVICYLPIPLHDNGPRIGVMRLGAYPTDKYTFLDIIRLAQLLQEITLREDDYANINGIMHILDMSNVTAAHLFQYSPTLIKKITVWSEEAMPIRQKGYHFVNTPAGFEPLFNMTKPMIPKKQQNRLHVHGNKMESLHKEIPKKYLPKEYGGFNGCLQDVINEWEQRILSYRDYYKEEVKYGADEKLRPGKPIDYKNLFGVEGSFRKLNVD